MTGWTKNCQCILLQDESSGDYTIQTDISAVVTELEDGEEATLVKDTKTVIEDGSGSGGGGYIMDIIAVGSQVRFIRHTCTHKKKLV